MKKIINTLVIMSILFGISIVPAYADDTYERICAPQGWTNCGEFIIYDSNNIERNRVIGPISTITEICGPNVCGGGPNGRAVLITSVSPQPVVRTETTNEKVTLTVTLDVGAKVVAPNSDGSIGYKPDSELIPIIDSTTAATLSATEDSVKEVVMFDTPKTRTQIEKAVSNKLVLIQRYLNRFYTLLNGWLIE